MGRDVGCVALWLRCVKEAGNVVMAMLEVVSIVGLITVEKAVVTTESRRGASRALPSPPVCFVPELRSTWCFAAGPFSGVAICIVNWDGVCPPSACGCGSESCVLSYCDHVPPPKLSSSQGSVQHQVPAGACAPRGEGLCSVSVSLNCGIPGSGGSSRLVLTF
jgi:hypothetical protein